MNQICPLCGTPFRKYGDPERCIVCIYGLTVVAFDPSLFINDKDTPLAITLRVGKVMKEYYDEYKRTLWDIRFTHRPETISHGHFADGVVVLEDLTQDLGRYT